MKPRTRIPPRRERPRRKRPELTKRPKQATDFLDSRSYVTKGGRVRLFGADIKNLRVEVFVRADGRCELRRRLNKNHHRDCPGFVHPDIGHLAHVDHGPYKTDTLNGTFWSFSKCHLIQQHNPKPITVTKKSLKESVA